MRRSSLLKRLPGSNTLNYGEDGEAAIVELLRRAEAAGVVPLADRELFID